MGVMLREKPDHAQAPNQPTVAVAPIIPTTIADIVSAALSTSTPRTKATASPAATAPTRAQVTWLIPSNTPHAIPDPSRNPPRATPGNDAECCATFTFPILR